MLRALLLGLALLPGLRVKIPVPNRAPKDFLFYGCDIRHTAQGDRWPLWLFVDIRDLPPQVPDPDIQDWEKTLCQYRHSWCDLHSMYSSRKKAMKDCDKWMDGVKKLLSKPESKPEPK